MKKFLTWMALGFIAVNLNVSYAQKDRNIAEYNLNNQGVGFINGFDKATADGFDPVSVFPEGGDAALKGDVQFALKYEGVEYLFANAENMKTFATNPAKFEPTYGGYCARAMVEGQKVHINTRLFTVVGNRSFFFVNSRAKRSFDRDLAANIQKADAEWKAISGEEPRL